VSDSGRPPTGQGPHKGQPERLGKYEIVDRLGQGAMGVVYKAHDPFLERDVALKVMLPRVAQDPEGKIRFEREAKAIARMVHPHVVTVFDLGYHTDGSPFIAMELLDGEDLQHAVRHGSPLALGRKIEIALQVLAGLGRAHAAGVVHRDIKPANVFLTREGNVKIMDFGIAFTKSKDTSTSTAVGTPDYMSPEQVSGGRVDERSDLFSVGAMLLELVSGRRPFHGETIPTIFYKIAHEEPKIELPEGPEYEALAPILRKALVKEAAERYQTAVAFAEALEAYARVFPEATASAAAAAAFELGSQETITISSFPTLPGEARTVGTAGDEPIVLSLDFTASPYVPEPPPPPADPSPVFKMMREIYSRKQTGHLRFAHGKAHRSLRFVDGQVLHAMSDVDGERLGDVLVRYGKLTQDILDRAKPIVLGKKRRLGPVLLENAFVDRATLDEGVGLHAREILFESAERGGGSAFFEESPPGEPVKEVAASNLSTVELVLEAARRVADPAVVRNVLGDLDRVLLKDEAAFRGLTNIAFTPADGFLASQIDGTTSARDLFKLIPLPAENVERSLFSLLCTGVVEYRAPVARASQTVRLPVPPPEATVRVPAPSAPAFSAPAPPPRPAAYATSKPVAARPPHPTDVSGAGRDLEKERQRVETTSRSVEESRRQIVDAFEALHRDHFEVLGIARTANDIEVKEAYFRLARSFHPDTHLAPGLADVADMRRAVFLRLGEAYEKLRSRESRTRYAEGLPRVVSVPGLAATPVSEADPPTESASSWAASESLRLAEMKLRAGQTWEAIQYAESAFPNLEGHDKLKARVLLARAKAKNPKWVKEAERSLLDLVKEEPQAHEPWVALGDVYRASQMTSRAIAMYKKGLELDPENHHARAALKELEGPDPGGSGLLKKIFKKN
jgi:serine/threonine protein kinase